MPRRPQLRDLLLGGYALACLLAVTWPGYDRLGNAVEPYVVGLPLSLAWVLGWVVLTFCALLAYHLSDRGGAG